MSKGRDKHTAIGLAVCYDGGNLGEQAMLESSIRYFERTRPDVEVVAFTAWPRMTERIHGVTCYLFSPGPAGAYYLQNQEPLGASSGRRSSRTAGADGDASPTEAALPGWRRTLKRVLRTLPFLFTAVRRARDTAARVRWEAKHAVDTFRVLRGLDALVINGSGQFNDEWRGAGELPFAIFKLSVLSALARTKLVFASVGVSELGHELSKVFYRVALRRSSYASVRDEDSRQLLGGWYDVSRIPDVPDLAFAFTLRTGEAPRTQGTWERAGVIALSPIAYRQPGVWSWSDAEAHEAYCRNLIEFIERRVRAGERVRLFATSPRDWALTELIAERVGGPFRGGVELRLPTSYADGMDTFMGAIHDADVVVASRLHGVVVSHVSGLPVIAVPHDRKVAAHMEAMGLGELAVPIDDATADRLEELVGRVLADREKIVQRVRSAVNHRGALVREQFEIIADTVGIGAARDLSPQVQGAI